MGSGRQRGSEIGGRVHRSVRVRVLSLVRTVFLRGEREWAGWALLGWPVGLLSDSIFFFLIALSFSISIFYFEIQSNNSNIQINQTSTTLCIEFSSV